MGGIHNNITGSFSGALGEDLVFRRIGDRTFAKKGEQKATFNKTTSYGSLLLCLTKTKRDCPVETASFFSFSGIYSITIFITLTSPLDITAFRTYIPFAMPPVSITFFKDGLLSE